MFEYLKKKRVSHNQGLKVRKDFAKGPKIKFKLLLSINKKRNANRFLNHY